MAFVKTSTVCDGLTPGRSPEPRRAPSAAAACLAITVGSADTAEVPDVRRRVRAFLKERRTPESSVETALLVTSELVTNALLHARLPATLHIHCADPAGLRIEVTDRGPRQAAPAPEPDDEHGRGLNIVAALCPRHGTYAHARGATRWAEIATSKAFRSLQRQ